MDHEVRELLGSLGAIAIEGPRGVGKTETARRFAQGMIALDDPSQFAWAQADLDDLLTRPRPLLIDEWQRLPATWDLVRRAVDRDATPGQFLLTGSAAPRTPPTHSGAGRIVRVRMRPFALCERALCDQTVSLSALLTGARSPLRGTCTITRADYMHEIVVSGFPGFRHLTPRARRAHLDTYIQRVIEHDMEEQGTRVRRPGTLLRWLRAYAAATATTASWETIRDASTGGEGEKPAKTTIIHYREALEQLWLLDAVHPWLPTRNHLATLTQSPKHHLADPALAVRLLGLDEESLIPQAEEGTSAGVNTRDATMAGRLFESLVTLGVRVCAQHAEAAVQHLRTANGRQEIDLIVTRGDGKVVAIEVKLGKLIDDHDVQHLHWLRERIGQDLLDAIVVTSGGEAYRRPDGIGVVPAALLGP